MALNLLFLTQTYPRTPDDTSGPFIRDLARGLVERGDRVTVLTPHAAGVRDGWDDGGVRVMSFRYAPERHEVLGYSRSLDADETIRTAAGLVAPLYALAAYRAVRRELDREPYDLLHAHWVVPNGLAAWPVAARVPLAVGLHGSDVFLAERRGVRTAVGLALRQSALLTGCSPELVRRVAALGFAGKPARVIPYGVDVRHFSPDDERREIWRLRLGVPADAPMVLTVGRMVTKKGYHVLIEVLPEILAECPDAHFVFAGGGDRLEEFQTAMQGWAGRVHFPGAVLRDTLPDLYRAADLFVLPAVHDPQGNVDGLPNVILEAMATGLPVVASRISGIPLAIEDGSEGLTVPEKQGPALARALVTLVGNRARRQELGAAARRKAERELTWNAVAGRYRAAYDEALAGWRGGGAR